MAQVGAAGKAGRRARDTAERLVDDLLHLEVNVIAKPGMTARKMPDPAQALIDIIGWYDTCLCQAANRINPRWEAQGQPAVQVRPKLEPTEPGGPLPQQSPHRQTDPATGRLSVRLRTESVPDVVSEDVFDQLRERAVEAEAVYRHGVRDEWLPEDEMGVLLVRIFRNCDQVKSILQRAEVKKVIGTQGVGRDQANKVVIPLDSHDVVRLRKIWEIGTESVLMQTVVQLDGDVVTRIRRGCEAPAYKPFHDLHQEAVSSATRHWQFLWETAATYLTRFVGFFLPGGGS